MRKQVPLTARLSGSSRVRFETPAIDIGFAFANAIVIDMSVHYVDAAQCDLPLRP